MKKRSDMVYDVPRIDKWRKTTQRMLLDPSTWPAWPLLPLKRYTDGEQGYRLGVVFEQERGATEVIVYIANMCVIAQQLKKIKDITIYGSFVEVPKDVNEFNIEAAIRYADAAGAVADGWLVD